MAEVTAIPQGDSMMRATDNVQSQATLTRSRMDSRPYRWLFLLLLCSALFLTPFAWAGTSLKVEWKEGHLSVIAEETPLSEILREVARQTGMEIRGLEVLQERVSVNFAGLSLREGLQKLNVDSIVVWARLPEGGTRPVRALVLRQGGRPPLTAIPSNDRAQPVGEVAAGEVRPSEESTQPEVEPVTEVLILSDEEVHRESELAADAVIVIEEASDARQ